MFCSVLLESVNNSLLWEVFSGFDYPVDRQSIEWQLRSLILATDITRQQEFLSRFKVRTFQIWHKILQIYCGASKKV